MDFWWRWNRTRLPTGEHRAGLCQADEGVERMQNGRDSGRWEREREREKKKKGESCFKFIRSKSHFPNSTFDWTGSVTPSLYFSGTCYVYLVYFWEMVYNDPYFVLSFCFSSSFQFWLYGRCPCGCTVYFAAICHAIIYDFKSGNYCMKSLRYESVLVKNKKIKQQFTGYEAPGLIWLGLLKLSIFWSNEHLLDVRASFRIFGFVARV